jgi:hypothetical protein
MRSVRFKLAKFSGMRAENTHLQAGSDTVEEHGDHEKGIGWQPTVEGEG